ncbi:MAG: phytanoyl-CoA dioxygenase family protein [Chitinophagales bacterium]|nr:phytanoyl-CoA dioxygenase family protein [Chitinophagales bacterium]
MLDNIPFSSLHKELFIQRIREEGYIIVEDVIEPALLEDAKKQLITSIDKEAAFHGKKDFQEYGMLLCCPIYGESFLKLADNKDLMTPFDWVLGDTSIIYVYTSSSIPPQQKNYASRIHVDRPHFIPDFIEALGCLILLDDFAEDNGATWILPKSHQMKEQPSSEYFYQHAKRVIAPKGSVFYFHLRLWHAGGQNNTNLWRHSLGIGMVRGYMKQRIDIPRAMQNVDISDISDFGLQKLGFFSQPPISLKEYYLPIEQRMYKQRSEWKT